MPNQDPENGLFSSNNYVVKLRDERVSLPEYAALDGLWCEVQVQTTLNHAWAEMAHDTIYKRPNVHGFGQRSLAAIETRMNKIMRNYLMPAGYEFQKVVYDAERLAAGLKMFDRDILEELATAVDNNSRFDVLQRFAEYVLPYYNGTAGVYPEICAALVSAVQVARTTSEVPIQTPFGEIRGYAVDRIEYLAAGVFERLRYVDIKKTFDAACELYLGAGDSERQKRWVGIATKLSKNELEVWKQVGPRVQCDIVRIIENFSQDERYALKKLLLPVLRELLNTEVTGTSSTWNAITLHQGTIKASELLERTRVKSLEIVQELFDKTDEIDSQQEIIVCFMQATHASFDTA